MRRYTRVGVLDTCRLGEGLVCGIFRKSILVQFVLANVILGKSSGFRKEGR